MTSGTTSAFHLDKITRIHWSLFRGSSFSETPVSHIASKLLSDGFACHWQYSSQQGTVVDARNLQNSEKELWVFHINVIRKPSVLDGVDPVSSDAGSPTDMPEAVWECFVAALLNLFARTWIPRDIYRIGPNLFLRKLNTTPCDTYGGFSVTPSHSIVFEVNIEIVKQQQGGGLTASAPSSGTSASRALMTVNSWKSTIRPLGDVELRVCDKCPLDVICAPVGVRGKVLGAVAPNPFLTEEWSRLHGYTGCDEIVSVSVDGVPMFYPKQLVFVVLTKPDVKNSTAVVAQRQPLRTILRSAPPEASLPNLTTPLTTPGPMTNAALRATPLPTPYQRGTPRLFAMGGYAGVDRPTLAMSALKIVKDQIPGSVPAALPFLSYNNLSGRTPLSHAPPRAMEDDIMSLGDAGYLDQIAGHGMSPLPSNLLSFSYQPNGSMRKAESNDSLMEVTDSYRHTEPVPMRYEPEDTDFATLAQLGPSKVMLKNVLPLAIRSTVSADAPPFLSYTADMSTDATAFLNSDYPYADEMEIEQAVPPSRIDGYDPQQVPVASQQPVPESSQSQQVPNSQMMDGVVNYGSESNTNTPAFAGESPAVQVPQTTLSGQQNGSSAPLELGDENSFCIHCSCVECWAQTLIHSKPKPSSSNLSLLIPLSASWRLGFGHFHLRERIDGFEDVLDKYAWLNELGISPIADIPSPADMDEWDLVEDLCRQEASADVGLLDLDFVSDLVSDGTLLPNLRTAAYVGSLAASVLKSSQVPITVALSMSEMGGSLDSVRQLNQPHLLVAYEQGACLRLPPRALTFWEKIPAGPVCGSKRVTLYVMAMDVHLRAAGQWAREMTFVAEAAQLGVLDHSVQRFVPVQLRQGDPMDDTSMMRAFMNQCKSLATQITEANNPFHVCVLVVNPFRSLSASASLRRCVAPLSRTAIVQIVRAADVTSPLNSSTDFRDVAMAIYRKARTPYYAPPFIVDIRAYPASARFLHCAYVLSNDGSKLAVSFADNSGMIAETAILVASTHTSALTGIRGHLTELYALCRKMQTSYLRVPAVLTVTNLHGLNEEERAVWKEMLGAEGYLDEKFTPQMMSMESQESAGDMPIPQTQTDLDLDAMHPFTSVCVLSCSPHIPFQQYPPPATAQMYLPPVMPPQSAAFTHQGTNQGMSIRLHHALFAPNKSMPMQELLADMCHSFFASSFLFGPPLPPVSKRSTFHIVVLQRLVALLSATGCEW